MRVLFWLFVAIDALALGGFALLGLAAAGPSRTNPLAALGIPFLLPATVLAGAIWLHQRAGTTGARAVALLVAALPVLIVLVGQARTWQQLRPYRYDDGAIGQFRVDALRRMHAAIVAHDTAALQAALQAAQTASPRVDLNDAGFAGAPLLVLALREVRTTPSALDAVSVLLRAGADPNVGASELPLQVAIGASRTAGVDAVRLLLEAGADPNVRSEWGDPVYFVAGGAGIDPALMQVLLARGADVRLTDSQGRGVVVLPATTRNWPVLLLLLERGAPWRDQRGPGGVSWRDYVEQAAASDTTTAAAAVRRWLREADAPRTSG